MHVYIAKRALLFIPTMFLVTVLVFLIMRIIPGDPAILILAGIEGGGEFTEEDLAAVRHEMGTDRPLHVQYGDWVWRLFHGDMGTGLFSGTSVTSEIGPRYPLTLELALLASIVSIIVAVPIGILMAIKQDTTVDYGARIFTFSGISIPIFVVGILTVYLLVRIFNWFPPLGYASPWEDPWKNIQQMVFPVLTLAVFKVSLVARVTRSAMLEVMREDYIRTARSKGLREWKVIFIHALKNAFLPVITVFGWSFAISLGGTIVIERIYVVPGIGSLLIDSILARDYTLVQGIVIVFTLAVLTVNLLVDMVYGWVDPRIRYA